MRWKLAAAVATVVAILVVLYFGGWLSKLMGIIPGLSRGGGEASASIVVDPGQSYAVVESKVPFTLDLYIHVRVLGEGQVALCRLKIPDIGVSVALNVLASPGSEGWLTVNHIAGKPTPLTIQLLSNPTLPSALHVKILYCDGRTYEFYLPVKS